MTNTASTKTSNGISWNTRFYVLLAVLMAILAFSNDGTEAYLAVGSAIALFVVILVDFFEVVAHRHTTAWKIIKAAVLVAIMMVILIG